MRSFLSDWKGLVDGCESHYRGSTVELTIQVISDGPIPQALGNKTVTDVTRRDGAKCRITGLGSSIWDPLVVTSIFPKTQSRFNQVTHVFLAAPSHLPAHLRFS